MAPQYTPEFVQQVKQYITKHGTDKGLGNILIHNQPASKSLGVHTKIRLPNKPGAPGAGMTIPQLSKQSGIPKVQLRQTYSKEITAAQAERATAAQQEVGKLVGALTKQGLSDEDARHALMQELLQPQSAQQKQLESQLGVKPSKNIKYGTTFEDPTDKQLGGKGTFTINNKTADPFLTMKNATNKKQAFAKLTAASIERSPLGQLALSSNDPKIQVGAFKQQYSQQVMDDYNKVSADGGLADQYDAYLQAKAEASSMTAEEKRAAGLENLIDPLTQWGLSGATGRTWLGIDKNLPLDGQTMKAAATQKLQAENASIKSGFPQPGSHLGDVLKQLSLSPNGKQLVTLYENLHLPKAMQSVFGLEEEVSSNIQNPKVGHSVQDFLNNLSKKSTAGASVPAPAGKAPGL